MNHYSFSHLVNDMVKAIWKEKVIAETETPEIVEGNYYFPPDSVNKEFLKESNTHSNCPWKGKASYYHVVVDDKLNEDAAWYYPEPKAAAEKIKGYIAFWKGIEIQK